MGSNHPGISLFYIVFIVLLFMMKIYILKVQHCNSHLIKKLNWKACAIQICFGLRVYAMTDVPVVLIYIYI